MTFYTASGSIYELNTTTKQARCVSRLNQRASVRLTPDWRTYEDVMVELGKPAVISWTSETPVLEGSPEDALPTTMTSVVIKIEENQ